MKTATNQDTENETNTAEPHLEWLERRWGLPSARRELVKALIATNEEGSTALMISAGEANGAWGEALVAESDARPEKASPIVCVEDEPFCYLQSWRHFQAERTIARHLLLRLTEAGRAKPRAETSASLETAIEALFSTAPAAKLQVEATRTALARRFALITGGPGTGKTYTLARILILLLMQAKLEAASNPDKPLPHIRLAAPTGKAADRMKEAVRDSIKDLPEDFKHYTEDLMKAAESSCTLHSLLGYNPGTGECAHRPDNPLPCQILIVDEASMIDVFQWQALLEAMPDFEHSRLIILGDPYQLESVGAGDVLHQLVSAPALAPAHVQLLHSRRFAERPDIQALATAIVTSDATGIEELLKARQDTSASQGLAWLGDGPARDLWKRLPPAITSKLQAVASAETKEDALAALSRVRLLSAHRDSALGAAGLSETINRQLARQNAANGRPINEPIIINVNDPETGLRNGSIGILCTDTEGNRRAWFPAPRAGEGLIGHPIGKLPDYSLAWALTIHRSQGSEFDDILVVLPHNDSPLATRELIYTAITRARKTVFLLGPLETITKAVGDTTRRCTLLARQLHELA